MHEIGLLRHIITLPGDRSTQLIVSLLHNPSISGTLSLRRRLSDVTIFGQSIKYYIRKIFPFISVSSIQDLASALKTFPKNLLLLKC